MGTLRRLLLLVPWCLASCGSVERTKADETPDARAVIERYASVTKLAENLARTSSRRERGTVSFGGIEGTLDSFSMKPDRQKVTLELGGVGKMISGCDGEVAWISGDLMGSRLLNGMDSYQARLESAYDAPLKTGAVYESMRLLGRATFEGKECWKLELVAKPLEGLDPAASLAARTAHEYYEIASGLLVGVENTMDGELGSGPSTTLYADYRDFGGVTLAARKTARAQGVEMVYVTESIEFDTATEADLAPPLEVQKMIEAAAPR